MCFPSIQSGNDFVLMINNGNTPLEIVDGNSFQSFQFKVFFGVFSYIGIVYPITKKG